MLPFLKKTQEASVAYDPETVTREPDGEEDYDSLHSAADDLISAIHSKDTKAVAEALRSAFELCEDKYE